MREQIAALCNERLPFTGAHCAEGGTAAPGDRRWHVFDCRCSAAWEEDERRRREGIVIKAEASATLMIAPCAHVEGVKALSTGGGIYAASDVSR